MFVGGGTALPFYSAIRANVGVPRSLISLISDPDYFDTFQLPVGIAYQVPAGRVFRVTRIIVAASSDVDTFIGGLGYGDNAVVNDPVAPIGFEYYFRNNNVSFPIDYQAPLDLEVYFEIPTGKYPFWWNSGNGLGGVHVLLFGVEV